MSFLSDIFSSIGFGTPPFNPSSTGTSSPSSSGSNSSIWNLIIPAAASTIGAVVSANQGSKAANAQANAATQSAQIAADLIREQSAQARNDSAIQRLGGNASLLTLLNKMGIDIRPILNATQGQSAPAPIAPEGFPNRVHYGGAVFQQPPDNTGQINPFRIPYDGSGFDYQPMQELGYTGNDLDNPNGLVPGQTVGSGSTVDATQVPLPGDFGSLLKRYTGADLENEPGYKFRLQEGMKALEHGQAAKGGFLGGRAVKEAERYAQDYASGEYARGFDRDNIQNTNEFNRYATLAGFGNTATAQLTAGDRAATSDIAQNTINAANTAANARASGYVNTGNAVNSSISDFLKLLAQRN